MTLTELIRARNALVAQMRELLAQAGETRDFTPDEEVKYLEMESRLKELDAEITEEQARVEKRRARLTALQEMTVSGGGGGADELRQTYTRVVSSGPTWRNFGEFLHCVVHNQNDRRLEELRVQQMKDATAGGYAVPAQFRDELFSIPVAPAVIRPRADVIPAGSPPDAELSMPALDQRASQGAAHMYGGVQIYHQGESDAATESTMRLRKIALKPKKLTGYLTASNELLANWDAASAVIPRTMREAMVGAEDTDFLTGTGVNMSLGVVNAAGAIKVARAGAGAIAWADVYNMLARLKRVGGSPVWLASQTTLPQLVQLRDASSAAIWTPNAAADIPPTLYGFPVLFHDRSPGLGSLGDLVLADFKGYFIKDGSGPFVAVSEHVRFQNDEVAFRLTWNVDGQPKLSEPLALEGSTANTVSPFVILQ